MDNKNRPTGTIRRKPPVVATIGAGGVVAIIVVGIFVLAVIFILAKSIFSSNSSTAPTGLDTATIKLAAESVAEEDNITTTTVTTALPADTSTGSSLDSAAGAQTTTSIFGQDSTSSEAVLDVMYVTEYAQLHMQPDPDSENLVCMSPGVEVNVVEYLDNGYVKISFMNINGPLTGYLYQDYLTK